MNKKQLLLITLLLSGAQVNAMGFVRTAGRRLAMSTKAFGQKMNTKAGNFVLNGINRAEAKSSAFRQNLANGARNMSNSAKESAKSAPRLAGLAFWNRAKEDPRAAAGAVGGGIVGGVASGEGLYSTAAGVGGGALLGYHAAKTHNFQTWAKENLATKTDVAGAVKEMTTHADDLAKKGGEFARNIFRRLRKGQANTDKQVADVSNKMNSLATKADIERLASENKALHEKAYTVLTDAKGRIGEVWNKWVKDKS